MSRTLIIGDIHGCSSTFNKLLNDIINIKKSDLIYLMGDYIDRGPNSKRVVDIILELRGKGYSIFTLRGNHEQMLLDSLLSDMHFKHWLQNGGGSTLKSFNVPHPKLLEEKYLTFFLKTEFYFELKDFILVHGGLDFSIDNPLLNTGPMLWERNATIDKSKIGGKRIIVGHTPVTMEKLKKTLTEDKIMLDSGCVYNDGFKQMGNLTCLHLEKMKIYSQENIEKQDKNK